MRASSGLDWSASCRESGEGPPRRMPACRSSGAGAPDRVMDVTDVLRHRMREPVGLERMVSLSLLVHATAIAALLFAPGGWLTRRTAAPPTVMTITLSGGNGPANGGMTSMGGRPVQAEAPAVVKRVEPVRPPAVKTPQ